MIKGEIKQEKLCDRVYEVLYQNIINQNLKPSDRIVESEVAKALNVSRTPIREAIARLLRNGLLMELPSGGVCVAKLTLEQVKEVFDVRIALESYAAYLAVPLLSDEDLAMLVRMHKEAEATIDHDPELALAADRDMHQLLIDRCQNSRIAQILTDLYSLVQLFRAQQGKHIKTVRNLMEQRRRIIEALSQRDGELTEKLMREHIRTVQEGVMADINASSQTG